MDMPDSKTPLIGVLLTSLLALGAGLMSPERSFAQSAPGATSSTEPASGRWISTGSPRTARVGHTATRLLDGKVLVVGGSAVERLDVLSPRGTVGVFDSSEIYDPATRSWSPTGRLAISRQGHTATLLPDGRVLVAGGIGEGGPLSTAELYDPDAGAWSPAEGLSRVRFGHTAILLPSGRILITGGASLTAAAPMVATDPRRDEEFDPSTDTWSLAASIRDPRIGHTTTLQEDGSVLVTGGYPYDGYFFDNYASQSTARYDPVSRDWTITGLLGHPRSLHTATRLPNDSILIAGGHNRAPVVAVAEVYADSGIVGSGTSSELFDPVTKTWSASGSLSQFRAGHTATLLSDGQVLVAGGETLLVTPRGVFYRVLDSSELYESARATWHGTDDLEVPRTSHTASLLLDGTVLVVGGRGRDSAAVRSAELYVPAVTIDRRITGTWYDPAQPGHGLFIEVLPEGRFLAWWFTFNPAGTQQAWFGGVGTYSGNTATIPQVTQTSGGRWIPNFNPAQVVNNAWGSLSFEFTDLDHGRVDFGSVAGYGSGSMNLTRLTRPAMSTANASGASADAITPAFTGAWYDPAQAGHGLFVEVLPDNRVLAWWFTFDPSGTQQAWFGGVGTYSGNTATITAVVQPTGGRWIPNFNPQQVANNPWGTLTLEFSDCANGVARFASTRGYGNGSMNLTRLTVPVGVQCP